MTVPERMLSLAIGREGQNARLAAKLTGWRIDIRSDQAASTEPLDAATADEPAAAPSDSAGEHAESPTAQAEADRRRGAGSAGQARTP